MTTEVLGKLSFIEVPDVNGSEVMLNSGGVPGLFAGATGARPAAGTGAVGRIYLDTTVNRFYYDDGTVWVDLTPVPLIDGTENQISVVDGTNVTPSIVSIQSNPILPGTGRVGIPTGTTAERPVSPVTADLRYNSTTNSGEIYNGAVWSPFGRVLQVQTGQITASTGSTQIPFDTTLPTNTEGHSIFSTSFTPISATSRIVVSFQITGATGTAARTMTCVLFTGTTARAAASAYAASANLPYSLSINSVYAPASTATITFSGRFGLNGSGTAYVNQTAFGTLSGILNSYYTIMEVA